jgi:hypothetical protein
VHFDGLAADHLQQAQDAIGSGESRHKVRVARRVDAQDHHGAGDTAQARQAEVAMSESVWIVSIELWPGAWCPHTASATRREATAIAADITHWRTRVREYAPVATKRAKGGAN